MNFNKSKWLGLILLFLGCFSLGWAEDSLSLNRVTVALKPDKNPDKMLSEKKRLETYLSEKLGKPVTVVIPLSSAVIQAGFLNGTIDMGYLSSTDMAMAKDNGGADLLLAGKIDGKAYYSSYWLTLKDKPYTKVEDLRGKPVAFASKTSTSGFLMPLRDMHKKELFTLEQGPEAFFGRGNVYYGIGYVSAVERVLNGDAEAAAVSDYVYEQGRHLTPEQRARLKVMASQGPVPTHVIAVRSNLSDSDKAILRQVLLDLNKENPELRDQMFTSELIEVDTDEHLQPTREALELVKRLRF